MQEGNSLLMRESEDLSKRFRSSAEQNRRSRHDTERSVVLAEASASECRWGGKLV